MAQRFEIRVKGHLDESWSDWMGGLTITHLEGDETLLVGSLPDQAALHGVLNRLRDIGATLISVNPADGDEHGNKTAR